ncbi:MAG: RES domain-containing protein [Mycobacteriales bacterium]
MSFPGEPVLVEVPAGTTYLRVYLHDWYADALGQRFYGPSPAGRFDHHPEGPPRRAPHHGVGYVTSSFRCAVAEVFGDLRLIAPARSHRVGLLELTAPLLLADTRDLAAVPLGVPAGALRTRDRVLTQAVARQLHATTGAHGVLYGGWHTGEDCVALWERARPALRLLDDRSLLDLDLVAELRLLARELHYAVTELDVR